MINKPRHLHDTKLIASTDTHITMQIKQPIIGTKWSHKNYNNLQAIRTFFRQNKCKSNSRAEAPNEATKNHNILQAIGIFFRHKNENQTAEQRHRMQPQKITTIYKQSGYPSDTHITMQIKQPNRGTKWSRITLQNLTNTLRMSLSRSLNACARLLVNAEIHEFI
jgi:Ni/Co efflux regulator RcnB